MIERELVHLFLIGLPTISRLFSDDVSLRLAARAAMGTIQSWARSDVTLRPAQP